MATNRPIYFSFFMFDANTRVYDAERRRAYIEHMKVLADMGYAGFEIHPGRSPEFDVALPTFAQEIDAYVDFRAAMDAAGLSHVALATNVGAGPDTDPSSDDPAVREAAAAYLASRVDITHALGAEIMMGPVVIPYGAFLRSAPNGDPLFSDAAQDALEGRYANAAPVLDTLGSYAADRGVKVAIEPITHWETPGPNTVAQVLSFLEQVESTAIGVVIDSAHEALDGAGPDIFPGQVQTLAGAGRLHYAQASPPARGRLDECWLPWAPIFTPVLAHYDGPVAIEIFNAIPAFAEGLRLSRRKYWIPGEDEPTDGPSAYDIARLSLARLRQEFAQIPTA